jgi:predicted methyltransferase
MNMRGRLFGAGAAALLLLGVPVFAATQLSAGYFASVVASADRPATDKARDADRKPAEMLAFAEVRPGQKVIELVPGTGYFTRLLSLAVGPSGHVHAVAANRSPELDAWAAAHGNLSMQMAATGQWKAPEPVDLVWTTQNYHDFKNARTTNSDGAALAPVPAAAAWSTMK